MSSTTFPRTLAAAAVIVAAGVVLWPRDRPPRDEPPVPRSSTTSSPSTPVSQPVPPRAAAPREAAAAARLRELNQMSETFRNTTFLIAIRDAGFLCNQLLGVYGGINDSTTWTASCSEMLAYTVRVVQDGGLGIEPVLQHLDGLPFVPRLEGGGEIVLPPQPIR
jgi:hypothetical protein